jgi:hypothetical protein
MKRYQFVSWFPHWQGLGLRRYDPSKTTLAYVYDWSLLLGFWTLRKWSTRLP